MNKGFWEKLSKPFFVLAPMADVTDCAFRKIIAKYSRHGQAGGGPDVFWTEFVSSDGLMSEGREALMRDLAFSEEERPIVAQLFGSTVSKMREASKLCAELGFDGIDINMGCPDKKVEKQGAGACMIRTPEVARDIIMAVKDGINDAGKNIPVSVKTRVGYNKEEIDTWIPFLLEQNISALTIHLRTRKEMSKVPAHYEYIPRIIEYRNKIAKDTLIIINGDVEDLIHAKSLANKYGCDGVMLGRAIFGNPWLFDKTKIQKKPIHLPKIFYKIVPRNLMKKILGSRRYTTTLTTLKDRLTVLVEHAQTFETMLGDIKNFAIMKKHIKAYVHDFKGAKELRVELMENGNSASDIKKIVDNFFVQNNNLV